MVDIFDRKSLFEILNRLGAGDKPAFGMMTAQHMVEHLAFGVRFCNGKAPQQRYFAAEKEQQIKAFVIGTETDIPPGFKAPVLPAEGLPSLELLSLAHAVENLEAELNEFDNYFKSHPSHKPINPTMGELHYAEWVRFQNRHFAHHFKQFRLL